MKCIICDKEANAKGSHIVPASLIKNCVGKHYAEESYEIDSSKASVDIYYGRDNLKNTNPEIKKHHYKEDDILCQDCETKLGILESQISTEILQKFRIEKFQSNFYSYITDKGFEILEPKRINNVKIHAYIYSIILRYCRDLNIKYGVSILSEVELGNIRNFVSGFLYEPENDNNKFVLDYNLVLIFDKYSDKGSLVFSFEEFKDPYIFYFCEVIVQLFTNGMSEKVIFLFNNCLNQIENPKSKLIVGPSEFFNDLTKPPQNILATEFITNGTKRLCELNGKDYYENLVELNELIAEYNSREIKHAETKALNNLTEKYGG